MTALIDIPPEREKPRDDSERWKPPGWVVIGGVAALILVAVITLMFTASDSQDAAEETKGEAISLAQTIETACASGTIPEQFRAACSQAPQTRDSVEAITGPSGPVGATGSVGPSGLPGIDGTNGTNGLPGVAGSDGANGSNGAAGSNGLNGAAGNTGAGGAQGVPGGVGPAGPQGAQGAQGAPGATGAQGERGAQGEPGKDGQLPNSYTVQRADGTTETCTFNGSPPPDYVCTVS